VEVGGAVGRSAVKRVFVLSGLLVALLGGLPPQAAQAHPLGNFTINHYWVT